MSQYRKLPALLALLLAIPGVAFGAQETFKLAAGTVKIEIPEGWTGVPNLMGLPLIVVGPFVDESRPTLTVLPTIINTNPKGFDPAFVKKDNSWYKEGREQWLKEHDGKSVAYLPYKEIKTKGNAVAHALGYKYKMDDEEFVEKTYFVTCNGKYFQLQSSMTTAEESKNGSSLDSMIASFSCE